MREIKFRFWRYDRMIEWQEFEKVFDLYNFLHKKDAIAMQYTGLKDKNGKDIYEGDIMKTDSGANQYVTYRNDMATFVCRFETGASTNISSTWEVIGNIYENPELLETGLAINKSL